MIFLGVSHGHWPDVWRVSTPLLSEHGQGHWLGGGIAVAHVEAQSQHFRRQFCLELGKLFGIASSDDEVISTLGEFACTSFTYSACSTGNQCNLFHSLFILFVNYYRSEKKCITFSVQTYSQSKFSFPAAISK